MAIKHCFRSWAVLIGLSAAVLIGYAALACPVSATVSTMPGFPPINSQAPPSTTSSQPADSQPAAGPTQSPASSQVPPASSVPPASQGSPNSVIVFELQSNVSQETPEITVLPSDRINLIGIISWALIGVGVLVVIFVLFYANRGGPPGKNGVSRKRYSRKSSRSKHRIDDNHYRKY